MFCNHTEMGQYRLQEYQCIILTLLKSIRSLSTLYDYYKWKSGEGQCVHMSHRFCMGKVFWRIIKWNHVSINRLCQAYINGIINPSQPHCFCSNTITYSVRSHMSQFCLNVRTQIQACLTNGRKRVTRDDVTKCFLFHKAVILTNLLAWLI